MEVLRKRDTVVIRGMHGPTFFDPVRSYIVRAGPARPVDIPEELSPARPMFIWARPDPALPARLQTDPTRPVFRVSLQTV